MSIINQFLNNKEAIYDGKKIVDEIEKCISVYYSLFDPSIDFQTANKLIIKQIIEIENFLRSPVFVYNDQINIQDRILKANQGLLSALKNFLDVYKSLLIIKQ